MRRAAAWLAAALALTACSGHQKRPPGPAPEYERPVVMPWDAGEPIDPLENTQGEAVDDDEPSSAPAPSDAGAADAPRELSPDAGEG